VFVNRPTLKIRDTGHGVRELKGALCALGYLRKGEVDDQFNAHCKAALECFQEDEGLTIDGVCGIETWRAINQQIAERVR
jgi:N-acetylmuramoyl-L-alanine amidase